MIRTLIKNENEPRPLNKWKERKAFDPKEPALVVEAKRALVNCTVGFPMNIERLRKNALRPCYIIQPVYAI